MTDARVLVVYYSRTGHTRAVADEIVRLFGDADVEEIRDTVNRSGWLGYLRAGRDAWNERLTVIETPRRDVRRYDLVVIGTPVWRSSVSVPVRTYLAQRTGQFNRVAFFLTCGGVGKERVFSQMEQLVGTLPEAAVAVRDKEIPRRDFVGRIDRFAKELELKVAAAHFA
jgi:menaquinone-dependent protoporphyrinogen IX oxidase